MSNSLMNSRRQIHFSSGAAAPFPDPSISHGGLGFCLRKKREMSVIMFGNTILSFILFYSNFPKDPPSYLIEPY